MDIKTKVTYYPLMLADGYHIFKRTEIISPVIELEDTGIEPTDNYNSVNEKVSDLNKWREDADLSDTQDTP